MLSSVTPQQRQAAHALSLAAWWPTLRELLDQEHELVMQLLTDATLPVTLHQLQGRAKGLKDFEELVLTAGMLLAKR